MMQTPLAIIGWRIEDAEIVVLRHGLKPINGRDLFDGLGKNSTQTINPTEGFMINNISKQCPSKFKIAKQIPISTSCIGRSKEHIFKIHKLFQPRRQKWRRYLGVYLNF